MKYDDFKHGAPAFIMRALGAPFREALESASSYAMFRKLIIDLNDQTPGCFVKAARKYGRVCSPGERELLKAILLLCEFAHVADEISAGKAYVNITRCGGDFRLAFAACVVNAGY